MNSTTWPDGVTARYRNVVGSAVDITHEPNNGGLFARCLGCTWHHRVWTGDMYDDTPEQTAARISEAMPAARKQAQAHAEKCRAETRPAN